ncbi:MAG: rRNA maturation RNase YbeY [Pyrinomonadaceae bacterium]
MPEVFNTQRKIRIEIKSIREFADGIPARISDAADKNFSIAFISDRRMKQLNVLFRGKDTTTDVLSFPHEPDEFDTDTNNLGDIVISVEQALKQAEENGLTLEIEIKQLILHGLLHFSGYDH